MDYKDFKENKKSKIAYFWHEARLNFIHILLSKLNMNNTNNEIFDIGCGTGEEINVLKKFGNVITIDKDEKALEILKDYDCDKILGDIENYKLKENEYNIICAFDVLEHLEKDREVIKKIHNSLKNNSYFVATVPAFKFLFSLHDIALEHKRRYNKKEIIKKLKEAGFSKIEVNYWNFFLFPLVFGARIIKKIILKIFKIKKYSSEAKPLPKLINKLFFNILNLENKLIKKGLRFPVGLSIYLIAKK